MSGPNLTIPTDTKAFTSLGDQIKAERKNLRELNKEVADLQKFGQKVEREVIDKIRATEQRIQTLQTKKSQFANVGTQDFMSPGQYRKPIGPQPAPAFNFFSEKGAPSFAGNTADLAGSIRRGEMLRTAMANGDVFGAMRLQALSAMHMRGGIAGRAASFIEGGGIGRVAGKLAPWMAGAAAVQGIGLVMSPYSESRRDREQEAAMFATSGELNPAARMLKDTELADKRRGDKYDILDKSLISNIPVVKEMIGAVVSPYRWLEGRVGGTDAAARYGASTALALRQSGIGSATDAQGAEKYFKKRALNDMFGSEFLGNLAYRPVAFLESLGIKSNYLAEKAGDIRDKAINGFKQLEAEGFRRISENNFSGAETAFQEASKAINQTFWRNPRDTWFQLDAGRKAEIGYAMSQQPLPPYRIGM